MKNKLLLLAFLGIFCSSSALAVVSYDCLTHADAEGPNDGEGGWNPTPTPSEQDCIMPVQAWCYQDPMMDINGGGNMVAAGPVCSQYNLMLPVNSTVDLDSYGRPVLPPGCYHDLGMCEQLHSGGTTGGGSTTGTTGGGTPVSHLHFKCSDGSIHNHNVRARGQSSFSYCRDVRNSKFDSWFIEAPQVGAAGDVPVDDQIDDTIGDIIPTDLTLDGNVVLDRNSDLPSEPSTVPTVTNGQTSE